jgi:hypothetical protein
VPHNQAAHAPKATFPAVARPAIASKSSHRRAIALGVASCVAGRLALEFLIIMTAALAIALRGVSPEQMAAEIGESLFLQSLLIAAGVWSCALGGYIAATSSHSLHFTSAVTTGILVMATWVVTGLIWPGPSIIHLTVLAAAVPVSCLGGYWATEARN